MLTQKEIQKAQKKVKAKREFYQHLTSFIIINAFLFAINRLTTPNYSWYIFPVLSWGVGLAFHYVNVFGVPGYDILDDDWESRELNKEVNKLIQKKKIVSSPPKDSNDDVLELKEVRKIYKDSDFV